MIKEQEMIEIGRYNLLEVKRKTDFGYYLADGDSEVLLPNKYVPEDIRIGDDLKVFVYCDSEDRPVATTLKPKVQRGGFARLRVSQTTKFGAFMDWGLEKELLVPFSEQHAPMKKGVCYVVKLCYDENTGRLYGSSKLSNFISYSPEGLAEGDSVRLIVFSKRDNGYSVIVSSKYLGILYSNELFEPLAPGDYKTGFVKKIREDGKIDVTLRPPGYKAIEDTRDIVLALLEEAGGFLPYNDKTEPSHIKKIFKMSKKDFKKIIGGLYRDRKIVISEEGITLAGKKK